jgi:hypothetical protein
MLLCFLSGCALVGPSSISTGRADYNEAINKTEDEQMLLALIKERYGETYSLLAVNSVTASVRFSTRAGIEMGFGPESNYRGELTPFSGGVAYEENPTISYAPIHGESYVRQLMSPIPLETLVLLIRNKIYSASVFTMLADRINDLKNPDFLHSPSARPDPLFERFVELNAELTQAGVLQWVTDSTEKRAFNLLITGHVPDHSEKVREYLGLLEIPMPADESSDILLPVYLGIKRKGSNGIAISTRSTFDLIQILRGAIDIPQEHAVAGLTLDYPPAGPAGDKIRIHSSEDKPKQATVAVKYRGYWFYVDETDMHTKMFYITVRSLWSISISSAGDQAGTPVLTIPVG